MLTKTILGLVTVFGLTGVGMSLAETRTGCCSPGSDCCFPGSVCCDLSAESADLAPAPRAKSERKACCAAGGCCAAEPPAQPAKGDPAATRISVDGMSCAGCAKTVGKAVSGVEGVESAVADVKTKTLTVTAKKGASPSPKAMWEAVEKAGYTPTRIEGAAGTFDRKPTK